MKWTLFLGTQLGRTFHVGALLPGPGPVKTNLTGLIWEDIGKRRVDLSEPLRSKRVCDFDRVAFGKENGVICGV